MKPPRNEDSMTPELVDQVNFMLGLALDGTREGQEGKSPM